MIYLIDKLFASVSNRLVGGKSHSFDGPGLNLGSLVVDGQVPRQTYTFFVARERNISLCSVTGTGKSTLLKWFAFQDIRDDRKFFFDLQGMLHRNSFKSSQRTSHRGRVCAGGETSLAFKFSKS